MKLLFVILSLALISSPAFANCDSRNVKPLKNLDRVNVLLWNAKHSQGLMTDAFYRLGLKDDLFLFQEVDAKAIQNFTQKNSDLRISSTIHNKRKFGVANSSALTVCESYTIEVADEPVGAKIDKGIVVQKIKFVNSRGQISVLKVINVHLPLFVFALKLGEGGFKDGLAKLSAEVQSHNGPVIVAGDFNGWNGNRSEQLIPEFAQKNSLKEVLFSKNSGTRTAELRLDRAFYKGLDFVSERTLTDIEESDHYIRRFTLRLN